MKDFFKNEVKGWTRFEIIWLLVASITIFSLSIYWKESSIGIISSLTGVLCVIFTGKGKLSAYIFGLINSVLYAYIAYKSQFYGEVMLNTLYYVPMQFIGFFLWNKNLDTETHELKKQRLTKNQAITYTVVTIISIIIYGYILSVLNGSLPYIDSISTCLSILAMIFSVKRLREQWVIWIIINCVTIWMWSVEFIAHQSNIATLLMWSVYLINSVLMLIKWNRDTK